MATIPRRSVDDALDAYFRDCIVDFDDAQAFKSLRIKHAPALLTVQIQRAQYNRDAKRVFKNNVFIPFGDTLSLERFTTGKDSSSAATSTASTTTPHLDYRLHAVFVHKGDVMYGHYYVFLRDSGSSGDVQCRWLCYNDSRVSVVADPEREVFGDMSDMDANAYCLVYARQVAPSAAAADCVDGKNGVEIVSTVCRSEQWKQLYLRQFPHLREMAVDVVTGKGDE